MGKKQTLTDIINDWEKKTFAPRGDYEALLRVARAAPGMMEIAETAMPDTYFQSDSRVCEMREALKELPENLLD